MADAGAARLPDEVLDWVGTVLGASVVDAAPRLGGVSREAWFVDCRAPDGALVEVFLRRDRAASPLRASPYTSLREASLYRSLAGTGIPVPRVLAVDADLGCVLMERLSGETHFPTAVAAGHADALAARYMALLADIHRLPVDRFDTDALGPGGTVADAVSYELGIWDRVEAASVGRPDPVRTFARRWLGANRPAVRATAALVHGDAGPGNFAFDGDEVTAVLDWELAHLGDPMEDLAWMAVRSVLQPFGDLDRRVGEYLAAGGQPWSAERFRYYLVAAAWRNVVALDAQLESDDERVELAWCLAYRNLFRRLLLEEIGAAEGWPPPAAPAEPGPAETAEAAEAAEVVDWSIHGRLVAQLGAIGGGPGVDAHRIRGVTRVLRWLERRQRQGADLDQADLAEAAGLLGRHPRSAAAMRQELCQALVAGTVGGREAHAVLSRSVAREAFLLAPVLGRLGGAHLPLIDPSAVRAAPEELLP